MSQSPIIIPPEYVQLIEERKRIRQALADSRHQTDMLAQLSDRISAQATPEALAPLTSEATPPQEIAAALLRLEQELSQIKQTEARIKEYHATIEKVRQRARTLMFVFIGISIVLASALLFVLHMMHIF